MVTHITVIVTLSHDTEKDIKDFRINDVIQHGYHMLILHIISFKVDYVRRPTFSPSMPPTKPTEFKTSDQTLLTKSIISAFLT